MKQHERTHKGSGAGGGGGGSERGVGSRGSSVVGSPVVGNTGAAGARKGSMNNTGGGGAGEGMDIDSTTAVPASASGSRPRRPQIRSELSEIMEGIDRDGGRVVEDGDADGMAVGGNVGVNGISIEGGEEDGEGESPGLDALATAASEMS